MRFLILVVALLSVTLSGSANLFRGIIKDKVTGMELIGGTVLVKEIPTIGATTELDGTFELKDLPIGKQITLIFSYVGYNTTEIKFVPTSETEKEPIVVELAESGMLMNSVQVTARAIKDSERSARLLEMNAMNVINVVSGKSIEISPDLNVADVVQRVSGITMERGNAGGGQYAILRGMDKRYNYTLVNGVKIPSPDNKNRYVPLNLFPSELLDRLEVTKSLTPDMEGDATGGAINMVMKDSPNHFTFNANAAIGYNTMFFDRDFMSFDKGGVTKEAPRQKYGSDYSATMNDFGKGTSTLSAGSALPNMIAGFSVGNRFFDNKLGVMVAGNFQNHALGTNSTLFIDDMSQSENTVRLTSMKERTYSEQQMQYGAHVKMDYTLDPKNHFELYTGYIGSDSRQVRETVATSFSLNYNPANGNSQEEWETRSRLTKQSIISTTLQGFHDLTPALKLDWSAVWSDARNDQPDNTIITLDNVRTNHVNSVTADNAERRWEKNSDRDLAAYVNLKHNSKMGSWDLESKVGGMYRDKSRTNEFVTYNFLPAAATRPVMGTHFNELHEIDWRILAPKGSVGPLNYDAGENIGAAYLMGTLTRDNMQLLAGVRAEHTDQSYYMQYAPAGESPNGGQKYWDFLPSVQFKYTVQENMNVRASYFRSVNRPGFFEIVPFSIINEDYMEFGNSNLDRAKIDNLDLRWEWFPGLTEQIMVGLFYKNIQDPIEYAYYTKNNRQFGYGPTNLGDARNLGMEFDVTKYFGEFGIKANYTYTNSKITTPKTLYTRNEVGTLQRIEKDQTRPLVGQAPHVANISLLYKNVKHGWDAQIAGTYTGEKLAVASHYYDADHWDSGVFSLDLSCEKRFKSGVSIFAKANNLLDTQFERYTKTTNDYNANFPMQDNSDGKTLIRKNSVGRTFLVGVRFKM